MIIEGQYSDQSIIRALAQESRTNLEYNENVDSLSHPDSGDCNNDTSIKPYYIDTASESHMSNSQRKESYGDADNSLCIIPKDKDKLVGVVGSAFLLGNSMTPMDGETRRRMSRVTIPLNEVDDDVVDDRNKSSQDGGQGKYSAQRRRSHISIAPGDEVLVVESQKEPQRRRSLISISLEDMNDLVIENPDDF
jgi:hypothetical protein